MKNENSITKQNAAAWSHLSKDWQIKRLTEWAEMLESRLEDLDPNYRSYPFGRTVICDHIGVDNVNRNIPK